MFTVLKKAMIVCGSLVCLNALADVQDNVGVQLNNDGLKPIRADAHAPIGVMGDHIHNKGEWMLSYRYQYMEMNDNRMGDTDASPNFIVSNVDNRFFGLPGQPANLRVVPSQMKMDMHMFGAMYAPTNWLTLMLMGAYMDKSMDHITYLGATGTTIAGNFRAKSHGLGDTKMTGIFKFYRNGIHEIHATTGISFPTGDIDNRGTVLMPNGLTATATLPYAMQLGSGTYDFLPGLNYVATKDRFNWGAQYSGTFRINRNNNYRWGNKHQITGWLSYQWHPWLSTSTRVAYKHEGLINGIDARIVAPVQTADPDNYGGDSIVLNFGFNLAGQSGARRNHRLAFEAGIPVYQNLNGLQMKTDFMLTAGWQYAF